MRLTEELLISPRLTQDSQEAPFTIEGSPKHQLASIGLPERLYQLVVTGRSLAGEIIAASQSIKYLCDASNAGTRLMVLSGPPGTGKSVAAALYLAAPMVAFEGGEVYYTGRWISAAEYCNLAPWGAPAQAIRTAPRCAIDDVGLEEDRNAPRIEELVSSFYDRNNTLVITTNLTLQQFSKRYGERTLQRIQEAGSFRTVSNRLRPTSKKPPQERTAGPGRADSTPINTKVAIEPQKPPTEHAINAENAKAALDMIRDLSQSIKTTP